MLPLLPLLPLLAAAVWVNLYNPTDQVEDPTGPCTWHAMFGVNGPTCGGTRAFYYLLHGHVVEAARFHLPAVLAAPVLVYFWLRWAVKRGLGRRLPALTVPRWLWVTYLVFFLVFTTVLRNLDFAPFAWFDIPNLAAPAR
ncbi:DUF2752 domain-containing protein [Cryptosporangium minutisporangium]|uniref:DUF2752 domain-containing protein n=1 Tax=Cryptosporangium minutisporangium TaxID=113569 RepID=UPI0031E6A99C